MLLEQTPRYFKGKKIDNITKEFFYCHKTTLRIKPYKQKQFKIIKREWHEDYPTGMTSFFIFTKKLRDPQVHGNVAI